MNNKLTIFAIVTLFTLPMWANAAPAVDDGSSSSAPLAPTVGEAVSTSIVVPSTGDSISSSAPTTPSTGDSISSSAPAVPSTGDPISSSAPATQEESNPAKDTRVYSGSGGGSVYTTYMSTSNCANSIKSFLKRNGNNDKNEVIKLQNFLNNFENAKLTVNGIFDEKTEEAVKQFQNKYAAIVLAPWGASKASGSVYITTQKKINQILCNVPMVLNADEMKIIDNYKNNVSPSTVGGVQDGQNVLGPVNDTPSQTNGGSSSEEVGQENNTSNTAAVANPSVIRRFFNFLKGLF